MPIPEYLHQFPEHRYFMDYEDLRKLLEGKGYNVRITREYGHTSVMLVEPTGGGTPVSAGPFSHYSDDELLIANRIGFTFSEHLYDDEGNEKDHHFTIGFAEREDSLETVADKIAKMVVEVNG